MIAYADDMVMWTWVVALLGTLVAFSLAWRSLQRAEVALVRVRTGLDAIGEVSRAASDLDGATRDTTGERVRLHTRASDA